MHSACRRIRWNPAASWAPAAARWRSRRALSKREPFAQRISVIVRRGERPLLHFRASWYCTGELEQDWDLHATGWHVAVNGDAPLEVELRMPIPLERMAEVSPAYTAHRAVNAVPAVCAALPGIRTTADLPQIIASLG